MRYSRVKEIKERITKVQEDLRTHNKVMKVILNANDISPREKIIIHTLALARLNAKYGSSYDRFELVDDKYMFQMPTSKDMIMFKEDYSKYHLSDFADYVADIILESPPKLIYINDSGVSVDIEIWRNKSMSKKYKQGYDYKSRDRITDKLDSILRQNGFKLVLEENIGRSFKYTLGRIEK